MLLHMNRRTTLVMDAALFAVMKTEAAREGRTLAEVVERTLRAGLEHQRSAPRSRLRLPSYDLGPFLIEPEERSTWSGGAPAPTDEAEA